MLFTAIQFFDCGFSFGRQHFVGEKFHIDRDGRETAACVFCAFTAVVCFEPFFKIIGPACVERTIAAF